MCVKQSPYKTILCISLTQAFHFPPVHSPAEAMFVCRGVFLQQSSELQQGELLEQIHLQHRLAANLELGRGQAGPMGVLEARPAEFLRSGAQGKTRRESTNWDVRRRMLIKKEQLKSWGSASHFCVHINLEINTQPHTVFVVLCAKWSV